MFNSSKRNQKGFTAAEIMVVIVIIGLLALVLTPIFNKVMVSMNITPVAKDLNQYAITKVASGQAADEEPFSGITQQSFANAMYKSKLKVATGSEVVRHGLSSGESGVVTVAESSDQFTLTATKLNNAACPDFITQMQVNASKVTLNGTTVKDSDENNNITTPYSVNRTEGACNKGDTNEAVFTYP